MLRLMNFLVFDLDGTLSDPAEGIWRCVNAALRNRGLPEVAWEDVSSLIGPPLEDVLASRLGAADVSLVDDLIGTYREQYARDGYRLNRPYPCVDHVLRHLHGAGIPLGVCTSKHQPFADLVLDHFGWRGLFRFVSGRRDKCTKVQQLARLLHEKAIGQGSVMIGDRAVDVHAALGNGLRPAGVLWGHGTRDELYEAGARTFLKEPSEIVTLAALL